MRSRSENGRLQAELSRRFVRVEAEKGAGQRAKTSKFWGGFAVSPLHGPAENHRHRSGSISAAGVASRSPCNACRFELGAGSVLRESLGAGRESEGKRVSGAAPG